MIKIQAFLSLEKSAATTIAAVWERTARPLMGRLEPLLAERKFDDAYTIAGRVTLNGVVEVQRKRLEELAVSSLLFGAHNVTGKVHDTSFVKGTQDLPYALQQALDQLTDVVETGGAEIVRKQLHDLIYREEQQPLAKAELTLAEKLNAAVLGSGKMAIDIGANLTTSRLVTLGFLAEAIDRKVDTYQVNEVLDRRTCPVCQYMHGKTFSVAHEYARVMQTLGTMDTKELKSISPWPSQSKAGLGALNDMSLGEMQTQGYGSPPYHPGCRGVLGLAGTVEEMIPLGQIKLVGKQPVASTPEEGVADLLPLDIVTDSELRSQIAQIADEALQQDALEAYAAGDTKKVRSVLVSAGIVAATKG